MEGIIIIIILRWKDEKRAWGQNEVLAECTYHKGCSEH